MPGSDRINWFPGLGWNPARLHVGLNGRVPDFYAYFTESPVFALDSTGYVHGGLVENNRGRGEGIPKNYTLDAFKDRFTDDDGTVLVTVGDGSIFAGVESIPRFQRWSDGAVVWRNDERDVVREVAVPDEGGKLVVEWETHVPLYDGSWCGDCTDRVERIDVHPQPVQDRKGGYWSDIDYYVLGTRVALTAVSRNPDDNFVGWLGDAHGTDPSISLVMDGPKQVGARFTDLPILKLGVPESGALSRVRGYWTYVPLGASELAVTIEVEESATDAILAVSQGSEIWVDDRGRIQGAEYQARLSDGKAGIAVTRDSSPPVTPGPYFIRVVSAGEAESTGTLSATVRNGVPIQASPRAFTFVAPEGVDPAPQTFEFRNMSDRPLSYLVESDQAWLRVEPQQGTLGAGETAEFTAVVSSTGVLMDVYQGNLTVVDADGTYQQGTNFSTERDLFDIGRVVFDEGISLPVTFAVIPPSPPASAASFR